MSLTTESAVLVLNPHVSLVKAAEPQWPKVDGPDPVRDLLQSNVLAGADGRYVHPAAVPSNPAVGADVARLEPVRILERRQPVRHRPRRWRVARGRRLVVQRFVRPLVIELLAEDVEASLLRGQAAC